MASDDERKVSRKDPVIRRAALLLSGLVLTPDDALERYRDRRAGDPELAVEHLRRARAILDAVGFAIAAGEPERWRAIELAWQALRKDAAKVPALATDDGKAKPTARGVSTTRSDAESKPAPDEPPAASTPGVAPDDVAPKSTNPPGGPLAPSPPVSPPASAPPPVPPQPLAPLRPTGLSATPTDSKEPNRSPRAEPAAEATIDETAEVDLASLQLSKHPLPFSGTADAPPSVAAELPPRSESELDETAALGVAITLEEALPFDEPPGARPAKLTMEQYASYRAECAITPENTSDIRKRYSVTSDQAHRALEAEWDERLEAEPEERSRFEQLKKRFEAWLMKSTR